MDPLLDQPFCVLEWAWHHRVYMLHDSLWAEWMIDQAFAAAIADLERRNIVAVAGYLPPKYASTSPVFIYSDGFLNAAYNPAPFLVVLKLKSLKPDEKTDWIGTAAADVLVSRLSVDSRRLSCRARASFERASGARSWGESEAADPSRAAPSARRLNVEQAVVGSYVVDGDKVLFNLADRGRQNRGGARRIQQHFSERPPARRDAEPRHEPCHHAWFSIAERVAGDRELALAGNRERDLAGQF